MPKSRKRKGAKKYRPPPPPGDTPAPGAVPEPRPRVNAVRRLTIFFPLIAGGWLGGGFELHHPLLFGAVFAIAAGVHFFIVEKYFFEQEPESVKSVLLRETIVFAEMLIFPILGAYSQVDEFYFRVAIFGYVPACFLAAAGIAEYAGVFEAEGWERSAVKMLKNGEETVRPAALTRLFTLLLIAGPFLPIVLAPLGLVPTTLLLSVVPLYFMAPLATGFFESLKSNEEIATTCEKLAGAAGALAFFGGLLAQY